MIDRYRPVSTGRVVILISKGNWSLIVRVMYLLCLGAVVVVVVVVCLVCC